MQAIILVGGEGTRLRPLTTTTPKPLLPIVEVAFLERQLDWLASYGIKDVVLSLGYLPDAFFAHFPNNRFGDVNLRYVVEPSPLGTAGAIRFAVDELGIQQRCVVCNGDVLTSLNLAEMENFHVEHKADATISLTWVDDPSAFGVVDTSSDGRVVEFIEKPKREQASTQWINSGTYILEPAAFSAIPAGVPVSIERETFPTLLAAAAPLYALATKGYWLDIGTPEKYRQAHFDVLEGAMGKPPVMGAQEVELCCWQNGSALVDPTAKVSPPSFLGAEVGISARVVIDGSTIGTKSSLGPDTQVVRSVLHDQVTVGTSVNISDSIIGSGAIIGDGASVIDDSIIGAGAKIAPGATMKGARLAPGSRAD